MVVRQQGLGTVPVFSIALQGADREAEFPAPCELVAEAGVGPRAEYHTRPRGG